MLDALLLLFFAWAMGGNRSSATRAPAQLPAGGNVTLPPQVLTSTPPWPQVVPSGLPTFPGSGWEFDEPPPAAVVQRAAALVSQLWSSGAGTFKVENTAGRWIAYRAELVRSGKKGVVAYRQRQAKPAAAPSNKGTASATPAAPARAAATSVPAPVITARSPGVPQPRGAAPATHAPAAPAVAVPVSTSTPPSVLNLPTLRYGMGLAPQPPVPEVKLLQQRLGVEPVDGRFGDFTRDAVLAFQVKKGLAPSVSKAELLRRQFGVVKQATWTALFDVRA